MNSEIIAKQINENNIKSANEQSNIVSYEDLLKEQFNKFIAKLKTYLPEQAIQEIQKAFEYASTKHANQKRESGEPYIFHPLAVADILADMHLDTHSIIAALLHDSIEDTSTTIEDINKNFSPQIASLVDGLTKIRKISFSSSQERLAENFRKMILAMAKDLRVILIKLADRLHNMRTIDSLPLERANRIASETLDIYAPLANRLGIYGIKSELEDLCFKQLKPDIYKSLKEKIAAKKDERQKFIDEVKHILESELKRYNFTDFVVYGRPKHFYSIYKKMVERRLDFEDIHDLFGFRIIVKTIRDCYEALGIVHAMWTPMPGKFKDYIAIPKPNLYQSLHTTVVRPNGDTAEIQIRTADMHYVCEYGIAAHWAYKENKDLKQDSYMEKFSWLRRILEWQKELKDPNEFLEAVKIDLFDEEIFVFTPKGDVISLPKNATALDFAFAVHTEIGLHTIGIKINGSIVPLRKKLESGDMVEVLTSASQKPSKDWLNFVVTSKARAKIRAALRNEQRERVRKLGKELFAQALEDFGMDMDKLIKSGNTEYILKAGKEHTLDDVFVSVGYGRINPKDIIQKAFPKVKLVDTLQQEIEKLDKESKKLDVTKSKTSSSHGILVSGMENVLINFAKCCHPLPGESIIGFITRGKGVTIHRASCPRALDLDPQRRIDVTWDHNSSQGEYVSYIRIISHERRGVLADVTQIISSCGANITKVQAKLNPDMFGIIDFELKLKSVSQLETIIKKIESLQSIISVERKSIFSKNKNKQENI